MATVCVFDLETTGLDVEKDLVTEIGWILYDTNLKKNILYFNKFILWPKESQEKNDIDDFLNIESIEIEEKIEKLTGISTVMLTTYGDTPRNCFELFLACANNCDYVAAHNYNIFDGPMLKHHLDRLKLALATSVIDTREDLPYEEEITTKALKYLAYEKGYILNNAHRAIDDCQALCHVISCYDFKEIEKRAKAKVIRLIAPKELVTFKTKDRYVKPFSFLWDPDNKIWYKDMKDFEVEEFIKQLEFTPMKMELKK